MGEGGFTKLDFRQAHQHLLLSSKSKELLTVKFRKNTFNPPD